MKITQVQYSIDTLDDGKVYRYTTRLEVALQPALEADILLRAGYQLQVSQELGGGMCAFEVLDEHRA